MLPESDPLSRIFVTERGDEQRKLIADALEPFVQIYSEGGTYEIELTELGESLPVRKRILALLLARKAISIAFPETLQKEGMSPKEIEETYGILGGTLRPTLIKLKESKLLQQDKDTDSAYFIPKRAVRQVVEQLKGKDE